MGLWALRTKQQELHTEALDSGCLGDVLALWLGRTTANTTTGL